MTNRELIKELLDHDLDVQVKVAVSEDYCDRMTLDPVIRIAVEDDGSLEIRA